MATTATKEEDLQWPVSKWQGLKYKIGFPKVHIICPYSECHFTVCIKLQQLHIDKWRVEGRLLTKNCKGCQMKWPKPIMKYCSSIYMEATRNK